MCPCLCYPFPRLKQFFQISGIGWVHLPLPWGFKCYVCQFVRDPPSKEDLLFWWAGLQEENSDSMCPGLTGYSFANTKGKAGYETAHSFYRLPRSLNLPHLCHLRLIVPRRCRGRPFARGYHKEKMCGGRCWQRLLCQDWLP